MGRCSDLGHKLVHEYARCRHRSKNLSLVYPLLKISGSLSESLFDELHDYKNKPNGNERLANPKPTQIHGTSQGHGSMVIVYSKHQNHQKKCESRQDALSQDGAMRMRVGDVPGVALFGWLRCLSFKAHLFQSLIRSVLDAFASTFFGLVQIVHKLVVLPPLVNNVKSHICKFQIWNEVCEPFRSCRLSRCLSDLSRQTFGWKLPLHDGDTRRGTNRSPVFRRCERRKKCPPMFPTLAAFMSDTRRDVRRYEKAPTSGLEGALT
jgi:hypothetical protein